MKLTQCHSMCVCSVCVCVREWVKWKTCFALWEGGRREGILLLVLFCAVCENSIAGSVGGYRVIIIMMIIGSSFCVNIISFDCVQMNSFLLKLYYLHGAVCVHCTVLYIVQCWVWLLFVKRKQQIWLNFNSIHLIVWPPSMTYCRHTYLVTWGWHKTEAETCRQLE